MLSFGVLGSRCLTGSALLDCHVLKGFGICMVGILDSLSDVWKASTGTHHVISSCDLLVNIKGLESTFFFFLPLTKLPHPNTIYRYIGPWCRQRGIGVRACVKSGQRGDVYTFVSREGDVQKFTGHPWPRGMERASEVCVKSDQRGDVHIL